MSDEKVHTHEDVVNAFYPDAEAEPLEAPTVKAEKDEEPAETEDETVEDADETEGKADESESDDETEEQEEESLTLDGEDHSLESVQEWKKSFDDIKSMQADCTKKWTEASELRKESESQIEKNNSLTLELEILVGEDSDVDLQSFKDIDSDNYDPDKYIELKDKFDKRKVKLAELKSNQPTQNVALTKEQLAAESKDFYAYDPKWVVDGKVTKDFQGDMKIAYDYLTKKGYSQDEVNAISYSHHWQTIIDASKFDARLGKAKVAKKKIIKTPKVTKPKAQQTQLSDEEKFYGAD